MTLRHLAVVMPAYNESAGLPGFLHDIRENLAPFATQLSIVVVNDKSTDSTATVLAELATTMPELVLVNSEVNQGHGPTALAAYKAGLALHPDALLHIDGDGQFMGEELPSVVRALVTESADVVHGVRRQRTDPWFRKVLTAMVGAIVACVVGHRVPDVNTPLRAYRPEALTRLIALVPANALVPHVHFSLAERRLGLIVRYVQVRSIPRRGGVETGTMWGETPKAPVLPPKRLRSFARAALVELWQVSLRPGRAAAQRASVPLQSEAAQ